MRTTITPAAKRQIATTTTHSFAGSRSGPFPRPALCAALTVLALCVLLLVAAQAPALAASKDNGGWDQKTGMPISGGGGQPKPVSYADQLNPGAYDNSSPDNAKQKDAPSGSSKDQTGGSTDGSTTPAGGDTATPGGGSTTGGTTDGAADIYGSQPQGPGGLGGMVLGWFKSIMGFVYKSTIGDLIKKVAQALQTSILGLPAPSGPVVDIYQGTVGAMRPVILVGILVTALLLMLRTSSYDIAYAGFSALPKFIGLGIAFAFLPQFMQILSTMTGDISTAFLPSSNRAADAQGHLFMAAYTNLLGAGILNVILSFVYTYVGFMVILVGLLKNIFYQLLFIVGPFALASSVIPGVSHLASSWFRGVLACAAIPIFWALELGLGSVVVSSPEVLFGDMTNMLGGWSNGIFTTLGAILILWLMYKTPFKILEWAFESYDASRGAWRGLARGIAFTAGSLALKSAVGGVLGGAAGSGGVGTSSIGKTGSQETTQRIGAGGGAGRGPSIITRTNQTSGARSGGRGSSAASGAQGAIGGSSAGSGQPGALSGGGSQLALPPVPKAIEAKYIKKEGTSPGMGKPGQDVTNSPLSRNKNDK